jgi:hypothetical protein
MTEQEKLIKNMISFVLHAFSTAFEEWHYGVTQDQELGRLLEQYGARGWGKYLDNNAVLQGIRLYPGEYNAVRQVVQFRCDDSCWNKTKGEVAQVLVDYVNSLIEKLPRS